MSYRKTAFVLAAGFGLGLISPSPAEAIFGFGKKDSEVLSAEDLAAQEAAARAALAEIRAVEGSASSRRLRGMYEDIVKDYPRTETAAEAQFRIAELRQADGDAKKAFAEFQELITNYPKSPRFGEAVKHQYDIAKALMTSDRKGFLGIGAAIQPSKLIEMFQQISSNAPFSEYAPLALYNIGVVNRTQNEIDAAIAAFDSVIEEYPDSHLKADAMLQKFEILGEAADRSNNPQNVRAQQEAGADALAQLSGDEAAEIQAEMGKLEDKENEKDFNIGRFYERKGNLRSAVVYYAEVVSRPSTSEYYQLAKERIEQLIAQDPSLAELAQPRRSSGGGSSSASAPAPQAPAPRPAEENVKDRSDYLGPPVPDNLPSTKPTMRTSDDDVVPIP